MLYFLGIMHVTKTRVEVSRKQQQIPNSISVFIEFITILEFIGVTTEVIGPYMFDLVRMPQPLCQHNLR